MPKSISGWFFLSEAMAKPPEPCMPILPVSKTALEVVAGVGLGARAG